MTDSELPDTGVRPGEVLAGKYRIERVLGQGGMGVVVAAHHLQLDEKVALKFLLPQALVNPEAVGRFVREARAAAKIKSEHVARVSDVGQLENGAPYMVMEYLDGGDLAAVLEKGGPLPVDQAIDFVLQASEAIAEAHSLGIVHRDLKPPNLFCIRRPDGQLAIKVLDFGISKLTTPGGGDVAMTRTSALVGSPALYMSPEQMTSSKNVDLRTDIWALGIILHELLTGKPPFEAEAITEIAVKVCTEPVVPLRRLRADVPAGVEQVVLRCLEKDRERRFLNLGELAVALDGLAPASSRISIDRILGLGGEAGRASSVSTGRAAATTRTAANSPGTQSAWGQTRDAGNQRKPPALAFAGIAVLALAAGGGALWAARRPPAASSTSPAQAASTPLTVAPPPPATPSSVPSMDPSVPSAAQAMALAPTATVPAPAVPVIAPPASAAPSEGPPRDAS